MAKEAVIPNKYGSLFFIEKEHNMRYKIITYTLENFIRKQKGFLQTALSR